MSQLPCGAYVNEKFWADWSVALRVIFWEMGKDPLGPACNDRVEELAEIVGVEETAMLIGICT